MKSRKIKKSIGIILALLIVIPMFLTGDIKALDPLPIKIGNYELQTAGTYNYYGGTVTYEPNNNKITIENVKVNDGKDGFYIPAIITGINNNNPIEIYLKGDNYFGIENTPAKNGIYASREIKLIGDSNAKLTCYIKQNGSGIYLADAAHNNLSITGGTYVFNDNSKSGTDGFNVSHGTIDIDNANITMTSSYACIWGKLGVNIANSSIKATSSSRQCILEETNGISITNSIIDGTSKDSGIKGKNISLVDSHLNITSTYVNGWTIDGDLTIENTEFIGHSTDDIGLYSQTGEININHGSNIHLTCDKNDGMYATSDMIIDNSDVTIKALKSNSIFTAKNLKISGDKSTIKAEASKGIQANGYIHIDDCKQLKASATTDSALKSESIKMSGGTIQVSTMSGDNGTTATSAIYAEKDIILQGIHTNVDAQSKHLFGIFSNAGTISLLARNITATAGDGYPSIVARETVNTSGATHSENIIMGENYTVGNNIVVSTTWKSDGSRWYSDSFIAPKGTSAEVNDYTTAITKLDAGMLANYTKIDNIITQIPDSNILKNYTDDSVNALLNKKNAIIRGKRIDSQDEINQFADDLQKLLDALTYKPANFTEIDSIINDVKDLNLYTDNSKEKFIDLQNKIDRSMNITQQSEVDLLAKNLKSAKESLQYKPADFSKIDVILKKATNLNNYTLASRTEFITLMSKIDRSMNITNQKQIDELAKSLEKAYANLRKNTFTFEQSSQNPKNKTDHNLQTSDNFQPILWILILFISGGYLTIEQMKKAIQFHK